MSKIQNALLEMQKISESRPNDPVGELTTGARDEHDYGGIHLTVDRSKLQVNGLLAPGADERRLAEEYRAVKRPLLANADPSLRSVLPLGNILMVASALSGEGKTFTCINLCLSIAREIDWSVVLVDADSAKPHLTRLFAAEGQAGFTDLLRDSDLKFDDLVMPTDVPGFSLLPAGVHDAEASELLASRRMKELCQEVSSADTGRMIVFDSSPLLLTTEATALAAQVGQVVMIVQADRTPRESVQAALDKLNPDKAINCVLNQASGASQSDSYGHYGIYGDMPTSPES